MYIVCKADFEKFMFEVFTDLATWLVVDVFGLSKGATVPWF